VGDQILRDKENEVVHEDEFHSKSTSRPQPAHQTQTSGNKSRGKGLGCGMRTRKGNTIQPVSIYMCLRSTKKTLRLADYINGPRGGRRNTGNHGGGWMQIPSAWVVWRGGSTGPNWSLPLGPYAHLSHW